MELTRNNFRKPFFYGWWIVIAAAVGLGLGSPPILVFAFPVFLKVLVKEFHASRSAVAFAFTVHNVVLAFACPILGRLIDRVGIRKIVLTSTLLFALVLIGNKFITISLLGIYVFNGLGALIGTSGGAVPYSAVISNWFDRRRGTALAVMTLGTGISAVLMPSLVQRVITDISWRAAYALYGVVMLLIPLPVVAAVLKDTPAQMGLLPDGADSSASNVDPEGRVGMTFKEARHTSTLWVMVGAIVLLGASVHACLIHLAAMLTDYGITPQTAALASSLTGFGTLTGRVGTGFLLDRYFGPRLAIWFSSGAALGIILLLVTRGGAGTFLGAFLAGLAIGAESDLIAYLTSRYFGLKSFAEIYGFAFGSYVLAGAGGALLMGLGFDRTGSYTVPLFGFLAAIFGAIVLFSRLGPYRYAAPQPSGTVAEYHVSAASQ